MIAVKQKHHQANIRRHLITHAITLASVAAKPADNCHNTTSYMHACVRATNKQRNRMSNAAPTPTERNNESERERDKKE